MSAPRSDACPLCAATAATPRLTVNGYDLVRCAECGLIAVRPMPDDDALRRHYQDPAYFAGEASQGYHNYADVRRALQPHFERRLGVLRAQRPARGRLLDFGCAAGYFLEAARADRWSIAGVELSEAMAQQASRALGIAIPTTLAPLAAEAFDAVTLWEVIEHVPRPVEVLRQLRGCLRPGGLLMLSTPNTGHWQAEREPAQWTAYRPPSHLLYFTEATLTEALRRAGFGSIAVQRTMPLPPLPGLLRRWSAPLQRRVADGTARPWAAALWAWRLIRMLGWGWQSLAHPRADIFATLEAVAVRPD